MGIFNEIAKLVEASSLLAAPRLLCANQQRTHTFSGRQILYVGNLQVSGSSYDPQVKQCLDGIVFEARPVIGVDRKSIELDVRVEVSGNLSRRKLLIENLVAPPAGETHKTTTPKPAKPEDPTVTTTEIIRKPSLVNSKDGMEMHLMSADTNLFRANVTLAPEKWVVAGVSDNHDKKLKGKFLMLIVSAEVLDKTKP